MKSKPIVTVVVLTYNSEKFVIDTLNSIAKQTYSTAFIELIVSDDGSKDNTIGICREWAQKYEEIFKKIEILTVPNNTGIPNNCNRGIKAGTGEWIKIIAGDDILLESCIENNIKACLSAKADICFSDLTYIDENGNGLERDKAHDDQIRKFFLNSQKEKSLSFLRNPIFLNVPSIFFSRILFDLNNGFDERIKLLEDQPFIIKTLLNIKDLHYFPVVTVKYRKHPQSIVLNLDFVNSIYNSFLIYRKPNLEKGLLNRAIVFLEETRFRYIFANRSKTFQNKIVSFLLYKITSNINR